MIYHNIKAIILSETHIYEYTNVRMQMKVLVCL